MVTVLLPDAASQFPSFTPSWSADWDQARLFCAQKFGSILDAESYLKSYRLYGVASYSIQPFYWKMDEEKDSSARVHVENHKETNSKLHNPHDAVLLENEQRASAERRLVKKLDRRLLPTIVIIYIMNYIDVRYPLYSASFCLLTNWFRDRL